MNYSDKLEWLEEHGSLLLRRGVPRESSWVSCGGCVFLSWDDTEHDIVNGLYDNVKESLWQEVNSESS